MTITTHRTDKAVSYQIIGPLLKWETVIIPTLMLFPHNSEKIGEKKLGHVSRLLSIGMSPKTGREFADNQTFFPFFFYIYNTHENYLTLPNLCFLYKSKIKIAFGSCAVRTCRQFAHKSLSQNNNYNPSLVLCPKTTTKKRKRVEFLIRLFYGIVKRD